MSFGKKIHSGNWTKAISLDRQIVKSIPLEENQYGHLQFDTTRTEIGEYMYQLKYKNKLEYVEPISEALARCIREDYDIDFSRNVGVIAMPPSNTHRNFQPVFKIAKSLATKLGLKCGTKVLSKTTTQQIKNIESKVEKLKALKGAFSVKELTTQWDMILVDDLLGTGATLEAATECLLASPHINKVYPIIVTRRK